jgi:beta-phosphoglucomutase-like phosphatase (HAD superfamily)
MDDFATQLRDKVKFDTVIPGSFTAPKLIEETLAKLLVVGSDTTASPTILTPDRCLWVSDRDDCLRAAKDAGLLTARVVRPNARRGNVSAHYTVQSVPEVQAVINEINGISFNTVLQGTHH